MPRREYCRCLICVFIMNFGQMLKSTEPVDERVTFPKGCVLVGADYFSWRQEIIEDKADIKKILGQEVATPKESAIQIILMNWHKNKKSYLRSLDFLNRIEIRAQQAVNPYKPVAGNFLEYWRWASLDEKKSFVPLVLEDLWKFPAHNVWRKLGAIQFLMENGDSWITPPLIERLQNEENAAVLDGLTKLIVKYGDDISVKALLEAENKAEAAKQRLRETRKALEEKLKKEAESVDTKIEDQRSREISGLY